MPPSSGEAPPSDPEWFGVEDGSEAAVNTTGKSETTAVVDAGGAGPVLVALVVTVRKSLNYKPRRAS